MRIKNLLKLFLSLTFITVAVPTLPATVHADQSICQEPTSDESLYDKLFPAYIEACGGTQEKPKNMPFGGPAGHSFFYIRGACRNTSAKFPTLTTHCDPSNPDQQGVGVSVDQVFDNVNWVAIDNRDLFFTGGLNQCSPLSQEALQQTINTALARHIFQNIKIRPDFKTKFEAADPELAKLTNEQWLATEGIGTNYAINYHRNIICARIPMPISRIQKTVDYLNSLNARYDQTSDHYHWTIFHDNCTHVVHNALAAAGVFSFDVTNTNDVQQLANLAVPGWEIVTDEKAAGDRKFNSALIYKNKIGRANIMSGWYPTQAGGIIDFIKIHDYKNDIAYTDSDIMLLDIPDIGYYSFNYNLYLSESKYRDLHTNLNDYLTIYKNAYNDADSDASTFKFAGGEIPPDFEPVFLPAYKNYLLKQIDETNRRLKLIDNVFFTQN